MHVPDKSLSHSFIVAVCHDLQDLIMNFWLIILSFYKFLFLFLFLIGFVRTNIVILSYKIMLMLDFKLSFCGHGFEIEL